VSVAVPGWFKLTRCLFVSSLILVWILAFASFPSKKRMEELIDGVCSSMKLLDKERARIIITEDDTAELRMRSGRCLVGRIMSDRRIQKEAFRTLMARLWKTFDRNIFVLKEVVENVSQPKWTFLSRCFGSRCTICLSFV
jgi:hypothetical protein